ncbi:galectin-2-like [Protopterus annectens]|uniref:galectin-2-like n=1 Tax=Protopterus annectens TaxID=7888 RepID=UPI001CF9C84A|nr:galectin-2-like [Protopterus annectens]
MSEKFEIFNLGVKSGATIKVKGEVSGDASSFVINLGKDNSDLALHFNPRFEDPNDGSVIVCNSKCSGCWESEQREKKLTFSKGSTVKFTIDFKGDKFVIKMPDGAEVEFPNRHGHDLINYLSVKGGFRVTSFKYD